MKKLLICIFVFPIFVMCSFCNEKTEENSSELQSDNNTLKKANTKITKKKDIGEDVKPFRWWCPLDREWFIMDFTHCPRCRFPSWSAFIEDEDGNPCNPFPAIKRRDCRTQTAN